VIAFVIGLNVTFALFGFYVAWRLWQIKQALAAAADAVLQWEYNTHRGLNPEVTPKAILLGQQGTAALRQRYASVQRQLQQLQRIFAVFLMGLRVLQPLRRRGRSPRRRYPNR
jgi:hypothetical protein